MRVRFFDTRLTEKGCTALAEAKGVNYEPVGKINCPEAAAMLARELLELDRRAEEHVYMAALNGKGRLLGLSLISKGTVNASLIAPREIFIRALLVGASQILLMHNHPSGSITPSREDINQPPYIEITPNAFFPSKVPKNPNTAIHTICRNILAILSPTESVPIKMQHGV